MPQRPAPRKNSLASLAPLPLDFDLVALGTERLERQSAEALVLVLAADVAPLPGALGNLTRRAEREGDFRASQRPKPGTKAGSKASAPEGAAALLLLRPEGVRAQRLLLLRLGDDKPQSLFALGAVLHAQLSTLGAKSAHIALPHLPAAQASQAIELLLRALAQAFSRYRHTKTKNPPAPALRRISFIVPAAAQAAAKAALTRSLAIAAGEGFTREWANRPANHATPSHLAQAASALARASGAVVRAQILGEAQIRRARMGALLAVAQGSEQEPRFIILRYQGAASSERPVALIGKGVCFDSGGISLKPSAEMDEMKFDMSGAASVLGCFVMLALLRPRINVVGLIPACENLPSGRAVKPGDVVKSLSGQTIEILNTDAEGRLILCDALTYAQRFKPQAMIDIATLTGGCVIALGAVRSGLMSNDDALAARLLAAGEAAFDRCWRLPLDDEYAQGLKSRFADMANITGQRAAGTVSAAKFLQKFIAEDMPWAHLDIAGTAWKSGADKGATARPVALLSHCLLGWGQAGR